MKLGVLPFGENDGGPFRKLFTSVKLINKPSDFDETVDALVFWGGTDIYPGFYGEKPHSRSQQKNGPSLRDSTEWALMKRAMVRNVPIIGVCRGAQMLCAMSGGTLIQHADNHNCAGHGMRLKDSNNIIFANSCHHQIMLLPTVVASGALTDDVDLLAWTEALSSKYEHTVCDEEGVIEDKELLLGMYKEPEIVHFKKLRAIGIQGHPEWMAETTPFVKHSLDVIAELVL